MEKKRRFWTATQVLKNHVGSHTTVGGPGLEQWLTDSSLHSCPVCSRLISTSASQFIERPLHPETPDLEDVLSSPVSAQDTHPKGCTGSLGHLLFGRPVRGKTATPVLGQISCACRSWSSAGNKRSSNDIRSQCERSLWQKPRTPPKRKRPTVKKEGQYVQGLFCLARRTACGTPTAPHQTQKRRPLGAVPPQSTTTQLDTQATRRSTRAICPTCVTRKHWTL